MELLLFEMEEEGSGGGRDDLIAVPIGPIKRGEEVTFYEIFSLKFNLFPA